MRMVERTSEAGQIRPIEAQIDDLLVAAHSEMQGAGPAVDFDFKENASELLRKVKEAKESGVSGRAMTYVILEAIDAIYARFAEKVPLETPLKIAAYEYKASGSNLIGIIYEGFFVKIGVGKSTDNWDSYDSGYDPYARFSQDENGENFLVPWVQLRVNDPNEDGGISYTSIPFDKFLAVHFAHPLIPLPRQV